MDRSFEPYFAARVQQIGREGLTGAPPEGFGLAPLSEVGRPNAFEAGVFDAVARGYANVAPGLIRPDAELLLQLAFRELVAQPLLAVRGQINGDLLGAIEGDARTITQNALEARELPELVSAHAIVNATSRSWSELRTARFEVWD
jgi:hypothetical protein